MLSLTAVLCPCLLVSWVGSAHCQLWLPRVNSPSTWIEGGSLCCVWKQDKEGQLFTRQRVAQIVPSPGMVLGFSVLILSGQHSLGPGGARESRTQRRRHRTPVRSQRERRLSPVCGVSASGPAPRTCGTILQMHFKNSKDARPALGRTQQPGLHIWGRTQYSLTTGGQPTSRGRSWCWPLGVYTKTVKTRSPHPHP